MSLDLAIDHLRKFSSLGRLLFCSPAKTPSLSDYGCTRLAQGFHHSVELRILLFKSLSFNIASSQVPLHCLSISFPQVTYPFLLLEDLWLPSVTAGGGETYTLYVENSLTEPLGRVPEPGGKVWFGSVVTEHVLILRALGGLETIDHAVAMCKGPRPHSPHWFLVHSS